MNLKGCLIPFGGAKTIMIEKVCIGLVGNDYVPTKNLEVLVLKNLGNLIWLSWVSKLGGFIRNLTFLFPGFFALDISLQPLTLTLELA